MIKLLKKWGNLYKTEMCLNFNNIYRNVRMHFQILRLTFNNNSNKKIKTKKTANLISISIKI